VTASAPRALVVGAGPAGLIAAETLATAGARVTVHDAMPAPARKFLMAGRGGLNLTHSEPLDRFLGRYGEGGGRVADAVRETPPATVIAWAEGLGQETFVGSSGRVFPRAMKASPLLRAWLARLDGLGVTLVARSRFVGWDEAGAARFQSAEGRESRETPDALVLALGGASWPRLGSDGAWVETLAREGVPIAPLVASNCAAAVDWNPQGVARHLGEPIKGVAVSIDGATARGDVTATRAGLEGGPVYALGPRLRAALARDGQARLWLDFRPDMTHAALAAKLRAGRPDGTTTTRLKAARLTPAQIAFMRDGHGKTLPVDADALARAVKATPVPVTGMAGLARAISTAGGVRCDALDERLMLKARPGVFLAGEMLDWDAPTGGHLLQACFATGIRAAQGALARLGLPLTAPRGRS
jgi:uncharacterized flavoprotein (TIGR03862 family)